MGPDRDSSELIDAVGKKRTAKECNYGGGYLENPGIRMRSSATEQSERRGDGDTWGQESGREFDE